MKATAEHVRAHRGLVVSIVRRYVRPGSCLDFDDLLQEGFIGLARAVETFDPSRGIAFSTYAMPWIRHYVGRAVANLGRTIRVPTNIGELAARLARGSAEPGTSPARVRKALAVPPEPLSLDAPLSPEGGTLLDFVASADTSPLDALEAKEDAERARQMLAMLPTRSRAILEARYGLGEPTLEAVGEDWGLTRERVRQIERDSLERLRRRASHDGKASARP